MIVMGYDMSPSILNQGSFRRKVDTTGYCTRRDHPNMTCINVRTCYDISYLLDL